MDSSEQYRYILDKNILFQGNLHMHGIQMI